MNESPGRPLIRAFLDAPLGGPEIEVKSMEIIDREAPAHRFTLEEWQIVRRMIHTTGDFGIMEAVRFSPDAIAAGVAALHGCRPLIVDSNMIRSGISLPRLRGVCGF
ncbi:MAG: precorrin-8X methylmutase, partial [Syntrophobacterales bacterium CG_4_8_14_3_um_filter_58_8]